jgi:hypothetical protein
MADQAVGDLHDSDDEDEVDLRPSKLRSSYDFSRRFYKQSDLISQNDQ